MLIGTAATIFILLLGTIVWLAVTAGPTVARLQEDVQHQALAVTLRLPDRPEPPQAASPGHGGPSSAHPEQAAAPGTHGTGEHDADTGLRSLLQTQLGAPLPPGAGSTHTAGQEPGPASLAGEPLPPAPDPGLVEETLLGALPRIGDDGRQPWRVYARPFDVTRTRPRVAIIITRLGLSHQDTTRTIEAMPAAVTLAFSPYPEDVGEMVAEARADGHETLMMLPLEPLDYPRDDPGQLTLLTSQGPEENGHQLDSILALASGYVGVIGEMGSRFAASPESFRPILRTLAQRGLLYVDNRPGPDTIAARLASEVGVARAIVDRTVDDVEARDAIDLRLRELEEIARAEGVAVGLAHPLPVTLERLSAWAATLEAKAIDLTPVHAVANLQPDS